MQRGDLVSGRYEIIHRIGRGGMGEVHYARDRTLLRNVAIKIVYLSEDDAAAYDPGLHDRTRQRFVQEARAVAQLEHRSIIDIYDFGLHGDTPFLVMPFFQGSSLARWGRTEKPSLLEWIAVFKEVLSALDHAHMREVLHRDIKAANILVSGRGADMKLKLIDWGVARSSSRAVNLTRAGECVGTLGYIDPAVLGDSRVEWTAGSDLYALGAVAFRALCNMDAVVVQEELSEMDTLRAYQRNQLRTPESCNPEVRGLLQDVLLRMLASDPAERPRTAHHAWELFDAAEKELLAHDAGAPASTLLIEATPLTGTSSTVPTERLSNEPVSSPAVRPVPSAAPSPVALDATNRELPTPFTNHRRARKWAGVTAIGVAALLVLLFLPRIVVTVPPSVEATVLVPVVARREETPKSTALDAQPAQAPEAPQRPPRAALSATVEKARDVAPKQEAKASTPRPAVASPLATTPLTPAVAPPAAVPARLPERVRLSTRVRLVSCANGVCAQSDQPLPLPSGGVLPAGLQFWGESALMGIDRTQVKFSKVTLADGRKVDIRGWALGSDGLQGVPTSTLKPGNVIQTSFAFAGQ